MVGSTLASFAERGRAATCCEASTRSPKAIRPCCIWPSFRDGLPTSNAIGQRRPSSRGFPWFDADGDAELPQKLARFLDDGEPPLVFTLGTAVVADARQFYHHSAAAAKLLGRRAILLVKNPRIVLPVLPEGVVAFDYAPFSQLFPRAAAIVHHGGIGTTGQAMRSGRPSLVMPCAWDQPDNAERAARLGIARTIARNRYEPQRVAAELRLLLRGSGLLAKGRRNCDESTAGGRREQQRVMPWSH